MRRMTAAMKKPATDPKKPATVVSCSRTRAGKMGTARSDENTNRLNGTVSSPRKKHTGGQICSHFRCRCRRRTSVARSAVSGSCESSVLSYAYAYAPARHWYTGGGRRGIGIGACVDLGVVGRAAAASRCSSCANVILSTSTCCASLS